MPASINLISFDAEARTVVFQAYGREKTIKGLGEFGTQADMIEYLQSVAETDLKDAQQNPPIPPNVPIPNDLVPLPDMGDFVGETLPDPKTLD
jgi:hypothetical protein